MVTSVKTPSNAVEFDIDALDLRKIAGKVEQVEALDGVLLGADTGESPEPNDMVAIGDEGG